MQKNSFIKKTLALAAASLLAMPALAVWTVKDGKLLDPNGQPFVFRGATVDGTLAPEKTLPAIKDIAAAGANAVQVGINANFYTPVTNTRGPQLRAIIDTCKANKVICVLEPNDVAGYPDSSSVTVPATIANYYWSEPDIEAALRGQQDYVILGFGNQAFSHIPASDYVALMQAYLNPYTRPLLHDFVVMIDGNGWSQDRDKAMLALAAELQRFGTYYPHIIYSVDMFDEYVSPESVRSYVASFTDAGFPLVIGGFAPVPYYHPHFPGPLPQNAPRLPAEAVMEYAEQYGVGYFGWSWSGNKNPALDLVTNYNAGALTSWGNLLLNGVNGIKVTAKSASIFNGSSSSSSSNSSLPGNQTPVAGIESYIVQRACGSVYGELTARSSTDPDGDPLTYEWTVSGDNKVYTGQNLTYFMRGGLLYTFTLTVKDGKGGVGSTSKILRHEYSDYCISSSSRTSSSVPDKSSSSMYSSSSITTSSSSSVPPIKAHCSYQIQSQWGSGFTAAIRIKNTSRQVINGWDVNWQYNDGSKITSLWNATLTGSNPYTAKNLGWNASIQPGQTIEFGFQGSKSAGAAIVPMVRGTICQ